jgi:hypothetical protein
MDKLIEWEKRLAGIHISSACKDAVDLANKESASVHFVFNDVDVTARPGDNPQALMEKWDTDREAKRQAWLASPEYKKREEERVAEEKRKREAHIVEAAKTENEMREAKEPWPYTMEQLVEYMCLCHEPCGGSGFQLRLAPAWRDGVPGVLRRPRFPAANTGDERPVHHS